MSSQSPLAAPPPEPIVEASVVPIDLRLPRQKYLRSIVDDLASGLPVSDERFDAVYPLSIRKCSPMHWTPVAIARRAAELLYVGTRTSILDVGSGAGKFCTVAALTVPAIYTGVEQRPGLAQVAREIARRYDIPGVSYLQCRMEEIDWERYTGFYFYNPFAENYYGRDDRIDDSVSFGPRQYQEQVGFVQRKLEELPRGTRMVTYYGYGGAALPGWVPKRRERCGDDYLILWQREW